MLIDSVKDEMLVGGINGETVMGTVNDAMQGCFACTTMQWAGTATGKCS